ncbi:MULTISPECIES: hypothetical protein [Chryseobacterium]|uniref:hypothetical protein n=1 Tax=Chryseobacterium TaxID=59732 RepID=UPI001F18D4F4|nr:hypothetical protein [Chryseobacterium sp. PS-8]
MGLFNRIFGKGNVESDKIAESDIQKIKSGEINKIYPILKPGDWVGVKAGALKQTIIGTQEEPELVVAFGYDTPDNFVFLMPHDLEEKKPSEILKEAYDNLEKIESNFEISETLNRQVLTASGQDFSSEKILCRSHMLKAHELLNAKELYVSIPRRKCMMITSKQVDEELFDTFLQLHNHTWNDDSYGNAQILNALFVVTDGQIEGMIPLEN